MRDPSFEHQVQQKMQKLEFTPSESVWSNIDTALNSQKKRRALPLFWAAVFFGLSIGVAGTWLYFKTSGAYEGAGRGNVASTEKRDTKDTPAAKTGVTDGQAAGANSGQTTPKDEPANVNEVGLSSDAVAKADQGRNSGSALMPAFTTSKDKANPTAAAAPGGDDNAGVNTIIAMGTGAGKRTRPANTGAGNGKQVQRPVVDNGEETGEENSGQPAAGKGLMDVSAKSARTSFSYTPGLANMALARNSVKANALTTKKSGTGLVMLAKSSHAWQFGFSGGIGYSSAQKPWLTHVGASSVAAADPMAFSALNSLNTNYGTTKRPLAPVTPGLSFTAGMLARKSLSPRWSASAGLNLHYYSTQTRVGEEVAGYMPISASLLTTGAGSPQRRYPYYTIGDDQQLTNKYYFLELPVTVQYKLNQSRQWPIYLEGGATVSWLAGSNAVYYSDDNAVYYKGTKELNKTQAHLSAGVMTGLPVKGVQIQAGPQVQYSLTSLDNIAVTSDQHLVYVGLHVVLMPGR